MVNSSSLGCEENGNRKASCIQTNSFHSETQSSSPITASSATQSRNDFMRTADINLLCKTDAVEPTPSKTDSDGSMTISYNSVIFPDGINGVEADKTKKSFFCSVPLEKVQTILSTYTSFRCDGDSVKICRKVLCLYCDRTFVNVNLRQKHIERCHSAKQLRRVSLRKHQNCLTSTPCIYCDKFTSTTHTLKELFEHLIVSHSNKYFGCLSCEDRYYDFSHLTDHNALCHNLRTLNQETPTVFEDNGGTLNATQPECQKIQEDFFLETTRSKQQKTKLENKLFTVNPRKLPGKLKTDVVETKKTTNVKNLRGKKFSVKSSRIIIKRSKRLQAKLNGVQQKKHTKEVDKKDKNSKYEQAFSTKLNEKSAKSSNSVNPYPEFDNFFQVKKITDHSIDNLKISSLTFDDVFDKAFFNRIKCNIQENLLHHIDGKLFKNEESESRISNFEKNSNVSQEVQNLNAENYGCELSLNAIAPTTLLLSSQFGEDPESQIEYGSKPSKKKAQIKKDEVHYKYFTRRKYQASILERKENRDLSKLDMWTQYIIKNRQQKVLDDKKSPKEILDYFSGEEYKNLMKREELNRILDRRGPFEDLREEVSKKAALDKLNGETENCINDDSLVEVGELLNDILNNVFELTKKETCLSVQNYSKDVTHFDEDYVAEIPSYLNLRRTSSLPSDSEIDKSDKIALICSSQETENFELPSNRVRGKNEKVELTGEWARSRIYVCAACGLKLQNIKQFLEHKSTSHQYVWVQHYEFVGNQSELYRHLSIPVLGKVGVLEKLVQCKMWKRSDARSCTKCGKQCNSLGELHRHILECGGDWTWMLVRKKYKYRPFGAKSRRKRRGLVKRIYTQKTEPSEKKMYKKSFDLPRQKASDADTIQRMLANLPPKRTTRKIICLKDGFSTSRNKQVKATKQSKFKCGKLIHGKGKEQNKNTTTRYKRTNKNQQNNYRRSLRCLNKVLTSRILDTNSSLLVRKKYKKKMKKQDTKAAGIHINKKTNEPTAVSVKKAVNTNNSPVLVNKEATLPEQLKSKRSSPRIEKLLEFNCVRKTLMDTMNVKRFFPVKKKKRIEDSKPVHEKKSATKRKVTETQDKKVIKQNIEEIKNSLQNVKSLRKRKRESKSVESSMTNKPKVKKKAVDGKAEASDKKRNLRNRLTVAKADAAANSSCEQDDCTQTKLLPFLEEIVTKDELAVELLPTPSEPIIPLEDKEKSCNLPLPAEDQEKQNKINLPITEDENMKYENIVTGANVNNCTNVIVEKNKKKIRKPARGLNDCIAMLTNKLNKNLEDSSANVMSICSYQSNSIDEESKKSEHILKVPLFNEHFQLQSIVNKSEQIEPILPDLNETKAEIGKEEVDDVVESSNENKKENCVSVNCSQLKEDSVFQSNGFLDKINIGSSKSSELDEVSANKTVIGLERKRQTKKSKKKVTVQDHTSGKNVKKKLSRKRNKILNSSETYFNITVKKKCKKLKELTLEAFFKTNFEDPLKGAKMVDAPLGKQEECVFQEQIGGETSLLENETILTEHKLTESDSEDEIPLSTLLKEDQCSLITDSDNNQNASAECDDVGKNVVESCEILNSEAQLETALTLEEVINDIPHYTDNTDNKLNVAVAQENTSQLRDLAEIEVNQQEENENEKLVKEDDNLCTLSKSSCGENITPDTLETEVADINCNKDEKNVEPMTTQIIEESKSNSNDKKHNEDDSSSVVDDCEITVLTDCNHRDIFYVNNTDDIIKKRDESLVNDSKESDDVDMQSKPNSQDNVLFNNSYKKESVSKFTDPEEDLKQLTDKADCITQEPAKENDDFCVDDDTGKNDSKTNKEMRKFRSAKAKALELIFDEALQELTENERNINSFKNVAGSVYQKDEEFKKLNNESDNVTITEKTSPQTVNQENTVDLNLLIDTNGAEEALNGRTSGFGCFASHEIKSNDFDEVKELRRSKRNSKKIASYNEIDLVDPLLDDLDRCKGISSIIKETTKNLFLDKPPKNNQKHSHKKIKNDSKDMKLSGDELFDLLKAKPDENVLSKPTNSFFNNFDEISNEFTNDNFDVLEDILEKSIAVIEENLTEKVVNLPSNSLEIQKQILNESASDSEAKTEPALDSGVKAESPLKKNESNSSRSKTKKKSKNSKHRKYQRRLLGEEIENKLNTIEKNGNFNDFENISKDSFNNNSVDNSRLQCNKINKVDPVQRCESDKNKVNYCEICNKFFCRVESLTKHKRTLTHISKLSELEAREAALKAKENELNENDRLVEVIEMADSRRNLNLLDILETIETTDCKQSSPFTVDMNNSNLKLADIINDVLNKPVLKKSADKHSFSNIIENSNGMQSEMKRYKSLAERKSFESENRPVKKSVDYFEPEISNTAGTILEKQITLLENIIENRSNLSYIDDLTITSSQSVNENISADHGLNITFPRQDDSIHAYPDQCGLDNNLMKSNLEEESFLKPSQYEEISEDSNLRNYDEQKSRKALNRDEELFLECCSLLKSGSEISNYSKKSTNAGKDLNNLEMKRCDEPEWLQNGCLSQKESDKAGEYFSDNSRVTTPLGDNFSQDESNSATISSHWNMNLKNKTYSGEFDLKDKNFTSFEKVFSSDGPTEDVFSSGQNSEEAPHMTVSSFDDAIRVRLDATDAETEERNATNLEDYYEEKKIELIADNKKMLTKGAMKVFEGLKVSIPTEDLNMAKILTCSPPVKKSISTDFTETKPAESINISRLERKSGLKRKKKVTTKSSQSKKPYNPGKTSKIHDIYDFEETQDNSDVFTRPDFRSFRNNHEKSRKIEKPMDSDNDNSQDAVSVDAFSSSTSSVSELVPNQVKSKTQQNITKKKCMIMGRIFKNAVKSRIIDENIRNIPIIDNAKLVEDFVLSCPEPAINHLEKSKMTEEEMNMAFDKLVNSDSNNELKQIVTESCSSNEKNGNKNNYNKKKSKSKNKKRSHTYSDSSDDEFKLQKSSKKRIKKKNNKIEDNCINLEQELKECIGVASRKSQRKCTSGKQNVLIEYWSSDESLLETELDSKMLETAILVDKSDYHLSKEAPSKFPEMAKFDEKSDCEEDARTNEKQTHKRVKSSSSTYALNRRKRAAVNPLYHWSSSSEDESRDLIEIKPIRDEIDDDEDRPIQHGWIVGDSPKKLVTMLAQAKVNVVLVIQAEQIKLAHQFWISYPPPGAGSSTSSKDKEKQQQAEEEKRTTTKEQRQLDYDAAIKEHHRSQREQWEIRQLDNDLLHQRHSEREREREEKELAEQQLLHADERDDFNLQLTCRAPIASLDCMEEFSAGSALSALAERPGEGGITKEQLLLSGLTHSVPNAPLQITKQTNVTPGLRYRNLGKSGLRVSNIGLGTWPTFSPNVTEEQAEQIIVLAVESGINVFDLSEAHSGTRAEVELGRILARRGWKRTCYIVTTKIYWSTRSEERGLSRKHIIESVKASLVRLQLSYIDVVIVHKADPMCPMEEVVRAMHYVISQGWVMYWGTARWSPVEVMEAYTNCRQFNCVTPIVEQTEYHMFCREKTELYMPELYNKIGVGLMAWSPISMGLSQGKEEGSMQLFSRSSFRNKYSSFSWTEDETAAANKDGYGWMKERIQPEETRRQSERIRELNAVAEKLGCSLSQLAIAWCLKNESVQCLLLGASTVVQLYDSIQSLQLVPKLNTNMVAEIERILENKPSRPPMVSTLALR